jgi:hypothetical protein
MKSGEKKFEIVHSFLMWVGADHYATIDDYVKEVVTMGVSKRIPNVASATKLTAPGTAIFLAHDEGEYKPCSLCLGEVACPECRKTDFALADLKDEHVAAVKDELKTSANHAMVSVEGNAAEIEAARLAMVKAKKKERRIFEKYGKLEDSKASCPSCLGSGFVEGGTGGDVVVDGKTITYAEFNYWLHMPTRVRFVTPDGESATPTSTGKIFEEAEVRVVEGRTMCSGCGGTGRMPCGKVFGVLFPERVEYVLKEEDASSVEEEIKARSIVPVATTKILTEAKRGCGKRKPGGFYVVTEATKTTIDAKKVVDDLVEKGAVLPDGVEVIGNFIRFLAPLEIESKRFRGLARFSLDPRLEEEVGMIADAMEDAA